MDTRVASGISHMPLYRSRTSRGPHCDSGCKFRAIFIKYSCWRRTYFSFTVCHESDACDTTCTDLHTSTYTGCIAVNTRIIPSYVSKRTAPVL
jgi:hypothetical protein